MPGNLQEAIFIPLIKKLLLGPKIFKNFRPISNLPFISKFIKRCVILLVSEHATVNNISYIFQSAYKSLHSLDTALLRVQNNILRAVDDGKCVFLVLLDLSTHLILSTTLYYFNV